MANVAKGTLAALGVGAGIATVVTGFKSMITAASDLNENVNKVKAIFKSGAAAVIADSNDMAKAFGTAKNEYLDAAGKFGGLFKGVGFAESAMSALSVQFVRLAGDASSFFNTDFVTAFEKLRSGLAGESEPLRDFGVFLTEDAVKAKAFAMGLAPVGSELSEQSKIQARATLILEALKHVMGDLARTSGEHAGRLRAFWGSMSNLGAELGKEFLPAATAVLSTTIDLVGNLNDFLQTTGLVSALGTAFTAIANTIGFTVGAITAAVKWTAKWAQTAREASGWFGDLAAAVVNPRQALKDYLGIDIRGSAKEALESLGWAESKPAAKESGGPSLAAEVAKALGKAQEVTAASGIKGAAKANAEPRFAGAVEMGSREAYSAILRSKSVGRGDAQERLWRESKRAADAGVKQVALLEELVRAQRNSSDGLITTMGGAALS